MMFEDMVMIAIWVLFNAVILLLAMFMYHVFKWSSDASHHEGTTYKKYADRMS